MIFYKFLILILQNVQHCYMKSNNEIKSQFSTGNDSWAVVACAKLSPNKNFDFHNSKNYCHMYFIMGAINAFWNESKTHS